MRLSPADGHLVINMVDCLTTFVELFEKSENDFPTDQKAAEALDAHTTIDNMAYAAQFPDVVDACIRMLSKELSPAEKDVLRGWKGNLLHDTFSLLGFGENGNALMSSGFGVIEVTGLTQEIAEVAPQPPCMVETVLMPYKGHIVYAVSLRSYNIKFGPGITNMLDEKLADVQSGKTPVIATAGEFISRVAPYRQEKQEKEMEALMRGIERDAREARGETTLPAGMHRGKLADAPDEERDRLVEEKLEGELGKKLDEFTTELAKDRAVLRKPRQKLLTALGDLSRDELEDIAFRMDLDYTVPGKKQLIDDISDAAHNLDKLRQFLLFCPDGVFEFFYKLWAAKGRIAIAEDQNEQLRKAQAMPPFSFLFYDAEAERFTGVIYRNVLDMVTPDELAVAVAGRSCTAALIKRATWAVSLYGLLSLDEFIDVSAALDAKSDDPLFPEGTIPTEERAAEAFAMAGLLDKALLYEDRPFRIETLDDTDYLVNIALSLGEAVGYEEREPPKGLLDYWQFLLDRHVTLERRPLEPAMLDTDFYDWVMGRSSAVLLRRWLDAHVPDDKDDLFFADKLMEDIFWTTQGPVNPTTLPEKLLAAYEETLTKSDADAWLEDLLALAMRFVNDIPAWEDNGYSPNELRDRESGQKTFYRENGRPMKVGRNDPCPCGSGKKYKKCCGR